MINCDRVFDVLTRGPFPTGAAGDAEVELHLATCPDCARLAAALRPAIELFEEAVGPDEGRDLPSYWGEAAVELPEPQVTCAPAVEKEPRPRRATFANYSHVVGDLTSASVWRVAALVALGMFIGSVVRTIAPIDFSGRDTTPTTGAGLASGGSGEGGFTLAPAGGDAPRQLRVEPYGDYRTDESRNAWIRLPMACLDEDFRFSSDRYGEHKPWVERRLSEIHQCCTRCHNAAPGRSISHAAISYVQATCRHCHFQ